jgi:hypothetical protein
MEGIFKVYIANNKKALTPKYNRKPRGDALGSGLPRHTPTTLGDALHNLRAALDHAYIKLVQHNGKNPGPRIMWPFHAVGDRQAVKGTIDGHIKAPGGQGPSEIVRDYILDKIQPYRGGDGESLVNLHLLDILDKHSELISTDKWTHIEDIRTNNGSRVSGITFVTDGGDAVAFRAGAGLDAEHNNKALFQICFGRGKPLQGKPIIPALWELAAKVDETLRLLETRAKETT